MSQIRQEAGVNVRGGPTPAQLNASRVPHCIHGLRGGMNDLFGVPVSGMATAIGVGPGVIQMDSFSSTNSYTSNNRNRFNNQNNNPSKFLVGGIPSSFCYIFFCDISEYVKIQNSILV